MSLSFVDRYSSTLASSYSTGGTSLSVTSASGLPSGACNFYVIVKAETTNTEEVFQVTNVSGTTLTVANAQAGTTNSNHSSGATIIGSIMTSAAFTQLKADVVSPSTQSVVTGSRAVGSVYQNTHSTTLWVSAVVYSSSAGYFTAYTDSNSSPTTDVQYVWQFNATNATSIFFPVLAGNYYKVTVSAGTPSVYRWTEWY
jgi:hypothetical protein